MKKEILHFLGAGLVIYLVLLCFIWATQERQLYFPPPATDTPFDVSFTRPDGVTLGGWVIPGTQPQDALVVFGGNAMPLAGWRQRQGLAGCTERTLILVPYRGYEGNPGAPRERELLSDGAALLDWAGTRYERVGALGISLGSGVAVGAAAGTKTELDVLALGTPFDRMDLVARDLMPWALPTLLLRDRYPNVERIGQVEAPVAVLRAKDDELILADRTQELLKAAGTKAQETVVAGSHDGVWRTKLACRWLDQVTSRPKE